MYDDMRSGEVYKTAQIPPYMFEEKFEELAKKRRICYLHSLFIWSFWNLSNLCIGKGFIER